MIKKFVDKVGLLALLCFVSVSNALAADEFGKINDQISGASKAGMGAVGTGLAWFVSVFLPLICLGIPAFMAYSFAKKKAEQSQDGTNKIPLAVTLGIVIGIFVFILIMCILGLALTQEASFLFSTMKKFWQAAVNSAVGVQ